MGSAGGVLLHHVAGTIRGTVSVDEPIAGIQTVAGGRGAVPYESAFEMTVPVDPAYADGILVEADNRGAALMVRSFSSHAGPLTTRHAGTPQPFPLRDGLSIASIQWQAGFAAGVPQGAQGIGEVIVRDFGRLLGGAFPAVRPASMPTFRQRILGGVSQSAWFVDTFIAEGFNADPSDGRGVYQAAFLRNGNGAVLAINRFAGGGSQFPYLPTDLAPLTPAELLAHPASDPLVADTSSYTDYFRLRASVFARAPANRGLHRYATAAAHAPGGLVPADVVFGAMKCNGGVAVPLNPTSDGLYLRPILLGLAHAIGARTTGAKLPADAPFPLVPATPVLQFIARLGDTPLWIPALTADGTVSGGVPLLSARLPLGTPVPAALPPVDVGSITSTCGNFSGWQPFTALELRRRYGSRTTYLALARRLAGDDVAAGYLLARDVPSAIEELEALLPSSFD